MGESVKLKQSILSGLNQVKADTFDEVTIKGLLVDIREYIRSHAILRELADFIAHPKRDRGMSHKLLNSRYAKLSLVEEQRKRIDSEDGWKDIKTEWDYSHAVLSSINVDRIQSGLFKILFIDGIEDIPEATLKKYYKIGRKEILRILDVSYFQLEGFHILKNLKHRQSIEDVLKFIRGFVSGGSAFDESDLIKDLENAISRIITVFEIEPNYHQPFKAHWKQILLCIMCLLHDARLTFYDGNEGRIFLTSNDGFLALATEGTVFQFSLFTSSLVIREFLASNEDVEGYNSKEIPWISAKRDTKGTLVLV